MVVAVDRLKPTSLEGTANIADREANQNSQTFVTLDEYRALSETTEERLEYRNGEIFTLSGGSYLHSSITVNIIGFLGITLRDSDFHIFNGNL
jgi:Uma2 family endonuclease